MAIGKSSSIEGMTSSVFDNGRRGNPRPGCDCEQCFGYCLVDSDKAARDTSHMASRNTMDHTRGALNFDGLALTPHKGADV